MTATYWLSTNQFTGRDLVAERDPGPARIPLDQRPLAFAVLFGAFVIRVAGDGSLTLVALPSGAVHYLRTGRWPTRPRLVVTEPEPGVMRVREATV